MSFHQSGTFSTGVFGGGGGGGTSFLDNVGAFFQNPLTQFGLAGLAGLQQQGSIDEANQLTREQQVYGMQQLRGLQRGVRRGGLEQHRVAEMDNLQQLEFLQGGRGRIMQNQFGQNQDLQGRFGGLQGMLNQQTGRFTGGLNQGFLGREAGINQGFRDRTGRVLGTLEGMGTQERLDIGQQFDSFQGANAQDLLRRGLGGTSVASGLRQGTERERRGALGRLDERLRQQRVGVTAQLTGDELSARMGLSADRLGAQERGGLLRLGTAERLGMAGLNMRDVGNQRLQGMDLGFMQQLMQMFQQQSAGRQGRFGQAIGNEFSLMDRIMAQLNGIEFRGPQPDAFQQFGVPGGAGSVPATSGPGMDWTAPAFAAGGAVLGATLGSSRRWKSNIQPLNDALDTIGKLRAVTFDWDDEHGGEHDIGMIAEEVAAVVPEAIARDEGGRVSGIAYHKLTPLLIDAVQELKAKNDDLESRLADLEAVATEAATH